MPTIEQIRAARALLDWSQSDLADHAGLSQTGIARIENGTNTPNSSTQNKILDAFTECGIEFIQGGVRMVEDRLVILQGRTSLRQLQDDIFHTLSANKDTVRILGIDEINSGEDEDYKYSKMHIDRLLQMGVEERILIKDSFMGELIAPQNWYRKIPEKYFSPHTIFIYSNKIALGLRAPQHKVLLLDNAFFAESLKTFFDFLWDNAN